MTYQVELTSPAKRMLKGLTKRYGSTTGGKLREEIRSLALNPQDRGERLSGVLAGYRSRHHGRFRIVFRVVEEKVVVLVVGVGHHRSGDRDDVYAELERRAERGQLE